MRYDKKVEFVYIIPGKYDPKTGNYSDGERVETVYASVMDTGIDTVMMIYGKLLQGSKTLHIQGHKSPPSRIRIDGKTYMVDMQRHLRTKESFVVSEVMT